jgi:hypothetical protein
MIGNITVFCTEKIIRAKIILTHKSSLHILPVKALSISKIN